MIEESNLRMIIFKGINAAVFRTAAPRKLHFFWTYACNATTLLLIMLLVAAPARAERPSDAALVAFTKSTVPSILAKHHVPGAVVAIVSEDRIAVLEGFGRADIAARRPVDPQRTLFRAGSITKLLTATAVMQLVEEGRLDLDIDVNRYLDFTIPATFAQPITLRHLLTHTAGFDDSVHQALGANASVIEPLGPLLARSLPARVRPPGREAAYSNYGMALAGYIVERASGQPLTTFVEQRIFRPLRMSHSTMRQPVPPALNDGLARGYAWDGARLVPAPGFEFVPVFPAGSLTTSGADMARFLGAQLNDGTYDGGRILQANTIAAMHRRQFGLAPQLSGIGLGFYERRINSVRTLGHGGDTYYFHSELLFVPQDRLGFFVSFNGASGDEAYNEFIAAFFDRFYPTRPRTVAINPQDIRAYEGHYRGNTGAYLKGFLRVLELISPESTVSVIDTRSLNIDGERASFIGRDTFAFDKAGARGDTITFLRDARGHVDGFAIDDDPTGRTHRISALGTQLALLGLLSFGIVLAATALLATWVWSRRTAAPPVETSSAQRLLVSATFLLPMFLIAMTAYITSLSTTGGLARGDELMVRAMLSLPTIAFILTMAGVVQAIRVAARPTPERARARLQIIAALGLAGACFVLFRLNVFPWSV